MRDSSASYRTKKVLGVTMMLVLFAFTMLPVVWALVLALRPKLALFEPIWKSPTRLTLDNVAALARSDFPAALLNSFVTAGSSTLLALALALGAPAAFALAKSRMSGKFLSSWFLLLLRMAPPVGFVIPLFLIYVKGGMIDTYAGLIFAYMSLTLPFVVWSLWNSFNQVPDELLEAGLMDGASITRVLLQVMLPAARPGVVAAGVLGFLLAWNDFFFALVITRRDTVTAPVAVMNFVSYASVDWGAIAVASIALTLAIAPVIVLANRYRSGPNIVFVLTDQQRHDTVAALGAPWMITPNLDALVARGTAFTSMYVTAPSCAPSRASLFSGTYPHTNGVFRNDEPWLWCWVELLAGAGYRCVNVGKMHTMPIEESFGFHERHVVENKDRDHPNLPLFLDQWDKALWTRGVAKPSRVSYRRREDYAERLGAFVWEAPEDLHPDVFVGDLACLWLERWTGDAPFFLQVGLPAPHPPYDPTQRYLDMYAGRELPEAIRDYDLDEQPTPLRRLRAHHQANDHDAVVQLPDPSSRQLRDQRAHYCANVTMIDEQLGKLTDALERRGVLDDTLIVFASDHGDCLHDHGHSQKWTMYEPSVRVPAILAGPGVQPDRRRDELVALFDLGPTILEAAGVTPPDWMEARSLGPLLRDESESRERVFAEHSDDAILEQTELMTMIREGDWKLVHFVDFDEGQLFDLSADPGERVDLWDEPAHRAIRDRLCLEILRWRVRSDRHTQGFLREIAGRS